MRPKSALAILALSIAAVGAWSALPNAILSQNATGSDTRGDDARLTSSLELGVPFDNTAQQQFENQLTFDERARLIKLKPRFALAVPDCPLPTSEPVKPFYVRFHEPLERSFADRLTAAGASFVGYAYPNTHFIRARDAESLLAIGDLLRAEPNVAGTLLRDTMDACSKHTWALTQDSGWDAMEFQLMFWRDTDGQRQEQVLQSVGAEILQAVRDENGTIDPRVPFICVRLGRDALMHLVTHPDIDWIQPHYPKVIHNTASAALVNAGAGDVGPSTSYNLDGGGLVAVVFDGGTARDTHNDLQSAAAPNPFTPYFSGMGSKRVLVAPTISSQQPGWGITDTSAVHYHAQHVTGTICGDGASLAAARGFAPEAYVVSMGWGSMEVERQILRHYFRHVADNHSYGSSGGGTGGYDSSAQASDIDIRDILLNMCKSAGNDGSASSTCGDDTCMKNALVIAATEDNGDIASFSSRGPTDDGRLVPHFAWNGVNLNSTWDTSDTAHNSISGTSMSAPSATGSIVLLSEMWQREMNNQELAPDVLRGILAATAGDKYNQGPDYRFGFGIPDIKRACDLILANKASGGDHVIRGSIRQGDTMEYDLTVTSSATPLKVVCSWLDIYASTSASVTLVNNIDLELVAPNGSTVHYPWRGLTATGAQTYQWTRTGANNRDNIELAEVDVPTVGTWKVRVKGTSIPANPQSSIPNDATGFVLVSENAMSTAQQRFEDSLNTGSPIAIPDNSTTGITRTFNVSNTNALKGLRVYVDVRHRYRGNIQILLRHPDNTTVTLEMNDTSTRPDIIGVYPDTRQYDDDVEALFPKPANGTWSVIVKDLTAGTTGTLEYLALELDYDTVNPPPNQPPTANAGTDQTVNEGATVNLNGAGSSDPENDPLTYQWVRLSGPTITIVNSNTATPSFTAPQVASTQVVVIQLTVDDGQSNQDTDTVSITINDVPAPNNPPTANAGVDFSVTEGNQGTLNGTASSDPDSDPLSYSWVEFGSSWVTLQNANTANPTFIAPMVSSAFIITFELTVDDGRGGSDTDTVVVTVLDSAVNNPPTASAGPDAYTAFAAVTQLDGSASTDPENDPLTYNWAQIGGANVVTLSGANTATPTFTAPGVDDVLVFQLTVDDGNGNNDVDTVTVTVNATGTAPSGGGGTGSGGGGGGDKGGCSTSSDSSLWLALLLAATGSAALLRRRPDRRHRQE
ncbi:MAG: S8 family serine peptidase [Planctomycetes bacterium]|nr:S8 family serine peptidase [Planctomycetota bacterium]